MNTYRVTARRSGEWWALEVPGLPGVHSQTKRLDRAEDAAREAIAVMLDVEPRSFGVEVEPQLRPEEAAAMETAERRRKEAEAAAAAASEAMRRAASVLTEHLSQRDAGQILGVSFQRVSQLLKPSADPVKRDDRDREKGRRPRIWAD